MYKLYQRIEVKSEGNMHTLCEGDNLDKMLESLATFTRLGKQEGCYVQHICTGVLGFVDDMLVLISDDKVVKRTLWIEEF